MKLPRPLSPIVTVSLVMFCVLASVCCKAGPVVQTVETALDNYSMVVRGATSEMEVRAIAVGVSTADLVSLTLYRVADRKQLVSLSRELGPCEGIALVRDGDGVVLTHLRAETARLRFPFLTCPIPENDMLLTPKSVPDNGPLTPEAKTRPPGEILWRSTE